MLPQNQSHDGNQFITAHTSATFRSDTLVENICEMQIWFVFFIHQQD